MNLTFQLPPASEVVPPPSYVFPVPAPQRPVQPLFPNGCIPKGASHRPNPPSPKKVSSRQRKSYRRSVLHRAALAASSLPPPKKGSLRQAALACVQHLHAESTLPGDTSSARKRTVLSPSNCSPLAQRIRLDLQLGSSEVDSPEKEALRSCFSPENSLSPISPPNVRGLPLPAPLAFTPSKTKDEIETYVSESGALEVVNAVEEIEPVVFKVDEGSLFQSCRNCDGTMSADHQCADSKSPVSVVEEQPPPLPLCHYCCHRGSGKDPVHYFLQCVCDDWPCTCWCYCTDA